MISTKNFSKTDRSLQKFKCVVVPSSCNAKKQLKFSLLTQDGRFLTWSKLTNSPKVSIIGYYTYSVSSLWILAT